MERKVRVPTSVHVPVKNLPNFTPFQLSYPDSGSGPRKGPRQTSSLVGPPRPNLLPPALTGDTATQQDTPISTGPALGSRKREVLCRGRGGEVRPFSSCVDGTRSTRVPANKQTCVIDLDCQVRIAPNRLKRE